LAGQPALLQRSFVYSHVHGAIGGSHEPDAYYERRHFQRVQSADGRWVWADPRNVAVVATLNVPPLVLKRYAPTAAPAAHDGDGAAPPEAAVLAPQLHAVAAQLEQVAERLEPVLVPAQSALGPSKPAAAAPVAVKPK